MERTTQTSLQILQSIIQRRGLAYLREGGGKFFVNAFSEMGGDKQDVTLLRYLTKCGGHEDLLDAASLSPAMQRAYYSQTVQKLRDKSLVSEELAHHICGIFWRAVYHREPPVVPQQPEKKSAVKPADPQGEDPEKLYRRGMEHRFDDLEEYLRCLRQAAELGHVGAARRLGFIYECGIDVSQDWVQCAYWCRRAAELGDDASAHTLGVSYAHGRGVPQDYEQALYWYRIAAERGVPFAKSYLPEIEKQAAQASANKNQTGKCSDNAKNR